jgi:CDP-glucose 4,6-dehydratase
MNPSFWHGKRVLLTGHTGFKGSWLCLLLNAVGAHVRGYALEPPTKPSLYALARIDELVESSIADIRDLRSIVEAVGLFAPDVVLHMAAQSVVLQSYEEPVETYSTNVLGTVNVLEAVRLLKSPCTVINVTTDKCYENKKWVWGYRENDALGGHDPYSNSKACAELVGQSYRDSFFTVGRLGEHAVGIASARAGNVIGGGDWTPKQLIPDAIAAFVAGRSIVLRHPAAVRPWQHVLDCLTGYLTLVEALARDPVAYSGGWNFGPSDSESRSVSYVVEAMASRWGTSQSWVRDTVVHAPEEMTLRLDVAKTTNLLRWRCRLSIDEALDLVASWYRGYHAGQDARKLSVDQIDRYLANHPASG